MKLPHRSGISILAGALVAFPPDALGQPTGVPEPRRDAETLYDRGTDAYRDGEYSRAIELFLAADALSPSAASSLDVGRAYERLGDSARALRHYRDYVRRASPSQRVDEVRSAIAELERRLMQVGIQQVTVRSEPNAELTLDGASVGSTPWTGELRPGRHQLVLTREGFVPVTRWFELSSERSLHVDERLVPAGAHAPRRASATLDGSVAPAGPARPPEPAEDTSSGGFGAWPWVTLAAGGTTLAAAGLFELSRRSAEDDARNAQDRLAYAEALDTMHDRRTAARALAGVGAGLVAVGATLVVLELGDEPDPRHIAVHCSRGGCLGRLQIPLR